MLQPRGTTYVAGGGAAVLFLFALSSEDGPVLCPFRRCTGGYCPGCGLTRSGGRLLRGDLAGSWQQHPYLIFGVIQAVVAAVAWQFGSSAARRWLQANAVTALVLNLTALTVIWVVRLINGSIPVPFG
jgi:hypothetical protein